MIQLIGPGGAGKTTTGGLLGERLGVPFVDLDERFMSTVGHIGEFIDTRGYLAYASQNVALYVALLRDLREPAVLALSSGFMTYPPDVHEAYLERRDAIAASQTTFILLPSLDFDVCVTEIVRRQLTRAFIGQAATHEEEVIRKRFWMYSAFPARKVETMRDPALVVEEIVTAVAPVGATPDRPPSLAADERQGRR